MADRDQLYQALRNADAAGDVEGAKKLAGYIKSLPAADAPEKSLLSEVGDSVKNAGMGFLRGAKDVVDTGAQGLANTYDYLTGADKPNLTSLVTGDPQGEGARIRAMNLQGNADFNNQYGDSTAASLGRIGGNIAATLPVGGVLGAGTRIGALGAMRLGASGAIAEPALALSNALASSGMRAGTASRSGNMLARAVGGAATGGASAGLVDPNAATTGAIVGGALPGALGVAGKAGSAIGKSLRGGNISPEVSDLATRANQLGIDIPADRITNSKPMNAIASALNYIPFSGRAATESTMEKQLTKAASNLIGQDSDNMAMALRKASPDLGGKFDSVLKNNTVKVDDQLLNDVGRIHDMADKELGQDGLKAITSQVDELLNKGQSGEIDGQAAYNIKRTLDRIGRRNTPEAFHALELKQALMGALDRSLGPEEAAAFAKTRQQYGNMIALEKIAKNGVEGDISVARLANMKNINNQPLQEIADIAAQFIKPREGQHGAMQRGAAAMGIGGLTGLPGLAATAAAGRGTNMLMNSNMAKNFILQNGAQGNGAINALESPALYRSAPLLSNDR